MNQFTLIRPLLKWIDWFRWEPKLTGFQCQRQQLGFWLIGTQLFFQNEMPTKIQSAGQLLLAFAAIVERTLEKQTWLVNSWPIREKQTWLVKSWPIRNKQTRLVNSWPIRVKHTWLVNSWPIRNKKTWLVNRWPIREKQTGLVISWPIREKQTGLVNSWSIKTSLYPL